MARRDLTEERTNEILDAFEKCVVGHGLEGSTMEMIAEEAGMKRTMIRHYIGNREALVNALSNRVLKTFQRHVAELKYLSVKEDSAEQLLEYFFGESAIEDDQSVRVVEALIAVSGKYPEIKGGITKYIKDLTMATAMCIAPELSQRSKTVAYGVVGLMFNHCSLGTLQLPKDMKAASRKCAQSLISTI